MDDQQRGNSWMAKEAKPVPCSDSRSLEYSLATPQTVFSY
jgi:hypothetical protein